jgi:hypothetical protein
LAQRICTALKQNGERCGQPALTDKTVCFWHDPEHEEAAAEARRLGGLRRRREGTLQGAYDVEGIGSVADIQRLLQVAIMDALGLDNSIARVRALISASLAAAKLLEVGEMEDRLAAIESALGPRVVNTGKRR